MTLLIYMADEFDVSAAVEKHERIIRQVQNIRDGLTKDVIDYYYKDPQTEAEERDKNAGMRKYLQIAREDIDRLLNGDLY